MRAFVRHLHPSPYGVECPTTPHRERIGGAAMAIKTSKDLQRAIEAVDRRGYPGYKALRLLFVLG